MSSSFEESTSISNVAVRSRGQLRSQVEPRQDAQSERKGHVDDAPGLADSHPSPRLSTSLAKLLTTFSSGVLSGERFHRVPPWTKAITEQFP